MAAMNDAVRPSATIVMDGVTAKLFREEALAEYRAQCRDVDRADDDIAAVLALRATIAELDEILTQLGWDRDIGDREDVEVIATADVLESIVWRRIEMAGHDVKAATDGRDLGQIGAELVNLTRWRDLLAAVRGSSPDEAASTR